MTISNSWLRQACAREARWLVLRAAMLCTLGFGLAIAALACAGCSESKTEREGASPPSVPTETTPAPKQSHASNLVTATTPEMGTPLTAGSVATPGPAGLTPVPPATPGLTGEPAKRGETFTTSGTLPVGMASAQGIARPSATAVPGTTPQATGTGATPVPGQATPVAGATPPGGSEAGTGTAEQSGNYAALREYLNAAPTAVPGSSEGESGGSSGSSSGPNQPGPSPTRTWTHPTPAPTIGLPTQGPPTPTPVPGEASVYLFPDNIRVLPGESFTVMVMIDSNQKAVSAYMISVLYDPLKTRLDKIENGDDPLLGNPMIRYIEQDANRQQLGTVHIGTVQTADANRPIGSKILVARLNFTAVEPGSARIEVARADLNDTQQYDMVVRTLGAATVTVLTPQP